MRKIRRINSKMLSTHLKWRTELLESLGSYRVSAPLANRERFEGVLAELASTGQGLPHSNQTVLDALGQIVAAFLSLCNWIDDTTRGDRDRDRHLAAARGQALVAADLLTSIRFPVFRQAALQAVESIREVKSLDDVDVVVQRIRKISVPIFLLSGESKNRANEQGDSDEQKAKQTASGPYVIKVMYTVDGKAWSTPQVIQARTIYDLAAKVTVADWPDNSDYLVLDYISTLDPALYRITPFRIDRPSIDSVREFEQVGHIEFQAGQSITSEPVVIRVRGTFYASTVSNMSIPATIVGYDQLRTRISDQAHTPWLSKYRSIDSRILEIVDEIRKSTGIIDYGHIDDFVGALAAVANYLGITLQEATYREGQIIKEKDFQKDLLRHMRSILGEEVKEAPKQAGGPTDIQYRSVTLELKVEKEIKDRSKLAKRYISQPTQYSSAVGAQLSIVCILDLTEKKNPPANPQNNITLETPQLHGFEDLEPKHPSKVAVVIFDGNLKLASQYS